MSAVSSAHSKSNTGIAGVVANGCSALNLVSTSCMMVDMPRGNRNGERVHPCLIPVS